MGAEKSLSSSHHRRYGSQPISVPFLWEQRPGMPKRHWVPNSIPLVAARFCEAKPICSSEVAVMPLKLVISVPFQWEERPGKPLLPMDGNLCSALAFDTRHGSSNEEGDANQNESWYSDAGRDTHSDSSGSGKRNELEVKSCSRKGGHLVKRRTMTLGELILLSRKLSCPKDAVFVREHGFFSMEFIRRGPFACFPFGTNHQKKAMCSSKVVNT